MAFADGINMEALKINTEPGSEMYKLTNAPRGSLVVVVIDASTRKPVWAGSAVGDIKAGRSSTEVGKRLAYAVKTMFKEFGTGDKSE